MEEHGLLFGAFVFLTAAVLVVPFTKRGGLGSVLGYLLAGVAIGPFGLRLITHAGDILHFAEFGVVTMLFLIGLELEPAKLWRLRKPIVGLGGAQVTVTAAAIGGVALLFGLPWQTAAVAGLALALSSTAIALQTLSEKNLLSTGAGQSAFSVLLFQDIAVIPMLAVIPLLALGGGTQSADGGPAWLDAVTIVGAVTGIVLAGRFLLRPLFRFIAGTGIREIFTAFSLLLVIATALLMQTIGLSPALGTFLAGVVLADSEYRHALESDIEPFKGLLLGLFFISVGMSINFAVLADSPIGVAGLVIGLVAVKFVILAGLARLFGLGRGQNLIFTCVLAQGGEFAFVLLQFALVAGAMPAALAETLIVVVALSMAVTPLLMIVTERLILPRLDVAVTRREPDVMDDTDNPVLIIGYGRFGQIIGRLLRASGFGATVLDNDPDHIDTLRKFGNKVFYGEATRSDLLEAAGAGKARLIVLAMDDVDMVVETAKLLRELYPKARLLARVRNRQHAFRLIEAGVDSFHRETFDSGLQLGREALVMLDEHPFAAREKALHFAEHDRRFPRAGFEMRDDAESLASLARQTRDEMERILRADRAQAAADRNAGWGT